MNGTWSSLPTATYLDLMSKGVIGGDPVKVEITSLSHEGRVAMVAAVRTTPTLRFQDSLTLVERDGSWWIVAAAVVVSPMTK
jgi:Putative lumazine-binding